MFCTMKFFKISMQGYIINSGRIISLKDRTSTRKRQVFTQKNYFIKRYIEGVPEKGFFSVMISQIRIAKAYTSNGKVGLMLMLLQLSGGMCVAVPRGPLGVFCLELLLHTDRPKSVIWVGQSKVNTVIWIISAVVLFSRNSPKM